MPVLPPTPETVQAAYYVISSLSGGSKGRLHGVLFNKGMCLLHYRLKGEGIDIQLPHCWYKHGDIVVQYWMPSNVQWPTPNEEQTFVYWKGPPPKSLPRPEIQKEIVRVAEQLGKEFREDHEGIERIVEEVYKHAPFEFQRRFRQLFTLLREWYNPREEFDAFLEGFRGHFQGTVKEFPESEFKGLVLDLHKYAFVSARLLGHGEGTRYLIEGLSIDFWEHFCKSLRVHPRGHDNVPAETLEVWEAEKRSSFDLFQARLKYWVTRAEREAGFSDFKSRDVQEWLFPASWGASSRDSSTTVDETVYS